MGYSKYLLQAGLQGKNYFVNSFENSNAPNVNLNPTLGLNSDRCITRLIKVLL
jgi:hypothetical protein